MTTLEPGNNPALSPRLSSSSWASKACDPIIAVPQLDSTTLDLGYYNLPILIVPTIAIDDFDFESPLPARVSNRATDLYIFIQRRYSPISGRRLPSLRSGSLPRATETKETQPPLPLRSAARPRCSSNTSSHPRPPSSPSSSPSPPSPPPQQAHARPNAASSSSPSPNTPKTTPSGYKKALP